MNKKAIAILGAIFLLIVGTLGFLIYSRYSGQEGKSDVSPPSQDEGGISQEQGDGFDLPLDEGLEDEFEDLPDIPGAEAGIVKLSDGPALSPVLFFNGEGVTYFDKRGQLYQENFEQTEGGLSLVRKKQLEIEVKYGISKILWPDKGNNFIAEINEGGRKTWSFFNSGTGVYTDLPTQITSLNWMPGGEKIIYIWLEGDKATLNISDPDSRNWQKISDMWHTDVEIAISPDGTSVLFYRTKNSGETNAIDLTTPDGKLWQGLVKQGQNYGVLWSPDSRKFLFGRLEVGSRKMQLWFYDIMTGETKNLGLFVGVDKAVWGPDSKTIYAAVPAGDPSGSGQPSADEFFSIDTETLDKSELGLATGSEVDARDLFLSRDGKSLFFRNAADDGLYFMDVSLLQAGSNF